METDIRVRRAEWVALRDARDPDPGHSDQVARLALSIFDALSSLHGLPAPSRELLEAAATLHDVGWSVSGDDHHKHSLDIVSSSAFRHTSGADRETIALVCRYHRGKPPSAGQARFNRLSRESRDEVRKLAAILRIADGLDRGHRSAVRKISAADSGGIVTFRAVFSGDALAERSGFEKKKGLFEEVFARAARLA